MAKEIVIWCECDLELDKRVPAREYEVTVDGTTRTIDLCDDCHQKHLAPLQELLDKFGQPLTGKRGPYKKSKAKTTKVSTVSADSVNADGQYICDYPDCGRAFNRPQGLGRHKLSHP